MEAATRLKDIECVVNPASCMNADDNSLAANITSLRIKNDTEKKQRVLVGTFDASYITAMVGIDEGGKEEIHRRPSSLATLYLSLAKVLAPTKQRLA